MTRPPGNSLRWLTLAVLLPLLVLGVLAWLGTRAQVRAAWSSAREEAKVAGTSVGEAVSRELASAVETIRLFPDPPVPGEAAAGDAVLDGNDLAALRKLRDDPAAGLSPAGLPRRALAGFRVWELAGDPADARDLIDIAADDAPSVLTPLVFQKLGKEAGDWPERWSRREKAREVLLRHPDVIGSSKWIIDEGEVWWLASDGRNLSFLTLATIDPVLEMVARRLPAWAGLRLLLNDRWLSGSRLQLGETMESVPVPFQGDLRLEILAARPDLIEAAARQQVRWTLGLLLLGFATSISALVFIHRAVARERRLNAMKSDFVASVSHELRAPVASIRLMADALTAEKIEPRTVRDFHRLISREGARLSTLIENVLDFARIEQGRKSWHFEPADLGELLTDAITLMEPLAAEKSISLVATGPFPATEATVDPGAIQQALVNLLDNAIKFSPANSQVEIRLHATGSHWEIQITDQGPGIPAAEHERVFQKFYRLGSELRRETQGTGIGLSLVKAVAEAHGGHVVLTSNPGQGSSFTLIGPKSPMGPILHSSP